MPALRAREGTLPAGALAVLYDKNKMEAGGYAAALADLTGEQVGPPSPCGPAGKPTMQGALTCRARRSTLNLVKRP